MVGLAGIGSQRTQAVAAKPLLSLARHCAVPQSVRDAATRTTFFKKTIINKGEEKVTELKLKKDIESFKLAKKKFSNYFESHSNILISTPFNDPDAISCALATILHSILAGKQVFVLLPERKLIPLPYFEELENLQRILKEIDGEVNVHFFHADDANVISQIQNLSKGEDIFSIEADFPHLDNQICEDTNIAAVQLSLCNSGYIKNHFSSDHHSSSQSIERAKAIGEGVFYNEPNRGACIISLLEILPQIDENYLTKLSPELISFHNKVVAQAIKTDFYVNELKGQSFKDIQSSVIAKLRDLLLSLRKNPLFAELLCEWTAPYSLPLSLGNLIKFLQYDGKAIIQRNDEKVLNAFKASHLREPTRNSDSSTELDNWSFTDKLVECMDLSLESYRKGKLPKTLLIEIQRSSTIGQIIMSAYQDPNSHLSIDDVRRAAGVAIDQLLKEYKGKIESFNLVIPLEEMSSALVLRKQKISKINTAESITNTPAGIIGKIKSKLLKHNYQSLSISGGGGAQTGVSFIKGVPQEEIVKHLEECLIEGKMPATSLKVVT